jgi:hypothetical protein
MPFTCPQWRGPFASSGACRERFDLAQLLEVEQPAHFAVHHLSVPGYRLQLDVYSRQGWVEMRTLLSRVVREGWTPAIARRHIEESLGPGHRSWSFTKGARLPGVEKIAWDRTIADVRLDTADHYGADVRLWAERPWRTRTT